MISHSVKGSTIHIETDALHSRIKTEGYVSGIAANALVDKKTGAYDLGFGLDVADFLLEPGKAGEQVPEDQYHYGEAEPRHGNIAKRYVEGPQICTQAKRLNFEIVEGNGFLAIKQWHTFTQAWGQYKAGSQWEQTIVFPENERFVIASDRITTVNACDCQFFRLDMPGHIKHERGESFEHVYLSYEGAWLPSGDFLLDFGPDDNYLYQRREGKIPERIIRGYQVRLNGQPGPWLVGMTLNAADVYEAWCHQRDYVCMIQEIGGRPTKPGDTFGAAYVVGWFDDLNSMRATYDKYKGWSGVAFEGPAEKPTGFKGLKQDELPAVNRPKENATPSDSADAN